MEHKDWERELVSQLLAHLHPSALSSDQAASGFTRLLTSAEVTPAAIACVWHGSCCCCMVRIPRLLSLAARRQVCVYMAGV